MVKSIVYLGGGDPRLYKRGVEVVIFDQAHSYPYNNGIKYYIFFGQKNEIFKWNNVLSISIKDDCFKYFVLNFWIIKLYFRLNKSIIIHSHSYIKTLVLLLKTNIFTVHDAVYYARRSHGNWKWLIYYIEEKLAYFRMDKIHFISHFSFSKSLLSKRKFKKDAVIIYNTTPFEIYMSNLSYIGGSPYPEDVFAIFTIRGIQERTRIDLLLDFAEHIKEKHINGKSIHIYIAGKGHLLDYYRKEQQKRNITNLTFLGYIPDETACGYYYYTDLVILPSEYAEGFGLPLIEAYYFNKPVIASNRCAIPEIVISKDFLFENTPDAIWQTLCNSRSLSFNYRKFYDMKYSNTVIFSEYKKLYDEIIGI
jgi:glycosyltransferase involved in cell wall biosynthesis